MSIKRSGGFRGQFKMPLIASGNFGTPITKALVGAGFHVTAISRIESTASFPPGLSVIRVAYTADDLTKALAGQDAAVCVVGPGGIHLQKTMVDAAAAAGVKRFIVDDFGWGRNVNSFPEFDEIHAQRVAGWDHAAMQATANNTFTWTGISSGNPIDWALRRFPLMGFDGSKRTAIIYDSGSEYFTGTTLEGIGQSVVGVLLHPEETRNRFIQVMSIKTCQKELLEAFEAVSGTKWAVRRDTTQALLDRGQEKHRSGTGGWILDLVVAQLFQDGHGRSQVAASWELSDADLVGVSKENPRDVAAKVLA